MPVAKQNPPADPSEAQYLDDFLCFAIYSTNLAVNRLNKPVLDELGLTYLQYIVLVALYEQDDQTVGGLGDKLFLDSSTLTPLLKRLETMGHVTRQRDPEDERQVRLRLTPQGRRVRERAFAFRGDFQHLREQILKLRANLSDAAPENP
jgi:DNA-binding MarR family transcriptional regulator